MVRWIVGLALISAVAPLAASTSDPFMKPQVLFDRPSMMGRVLVIDEDAYRYLRFDGVDGDDQSMIDRTHPQRVPMGYVRALTVSLVHIERPRRVLMIGLGGGTFTTLLHRLRPDTYVDSVEINPVVVEAAKKYFAVVEDRQHVIHVADGRAYLRTQTQAYDLIVLDAYSGSGIPTHLTTVEFFRELRMHLSAKGVVATNLAIESAEEQAAVLSGLHTVFAATDIYHVLGSQNLVLISRRDGQRLPLQRQRVSARALDRQLDLDFSLLDVVEQRQDSVYRVQLAALRHDKHKTIHASKPGPRIQVQGHRGARARFPENTLPAFTHALDVGADVLELDVQVTRDRHLVVMHDGAISAEHCRWLDGRALEKPFVVYAHTLAQLKEFDCGGLPNPRFPSQMAVAGTQIPTLDEVIDLVLARQNSGGRRVELNIETKTVPGRRDLGPAASVFAKLLVDKLRQRKVLGRSVVQSFDHRVLMEVARLEPSLRRAALVDGMRPDWVAVARAARAQIVSPHHAWIDASDVRRMHAASLKVVPWTVNEPAGWDRMIDLGVDGIISDDPEALILYLKERGLR